MKIKNVELKISAVRRSQYPNDDLPEFLLVGRSNVGKSSFINTIINRKNYARTSATPGKTQTMPLAIFFKVQAMDYTGAMLWVWTIVAISVAMILVLNKWSDKQQEIVGKRG